MQENAALAPAEQFVEAIKRIPKFVSKEGTVMKNVLFDAIYENDPILIDVIRSIPELYRTYFTQLEDGTEIFNQVKFGWLVSNKEFLPDSYTRFANKIGLAEVGENDTYRMIGQNNDVVLTFPYKDCILEGGQSKTDAKRDERFYNVTLSPEKIDSLLQPKVLANPLRYTKDGVSDATEYGGDNLIIKGNNLLVLYSLLDRFEGKIRCIYIDPPYYFNTNKGEDTFLYNSNFKLSTWLVFMKNRLEVAKRLLSDDGAIFVQISDDGVAELHLLMKEVFGVSNFINKITVKTRSPSGFASVNPGVFESAEYILAFAKDKKQWTFHTIYVPTDYDVNYKWVVVNKSMPYEYWEIKSIGDVVANNQGFSTKKDAVKKLGDHAFSKLVSDYALQNPDKVFRFTAIGNDAGAETVKAREESKTNGDKILKVERSGHYTIYILRGQEISFYSKKVRNIDGTDVPSIQLSNIWTDTPYEGIAPEGGVQLKGGKKPEKLLKRIIEMSTDPGDIVMDFFLGSGTTCAVAHKMNRRYIGVEQLDYGTNDSLSRMKNVLEGDLSGISKIVNWQGGGSFVFCELKKLNMVYIDKLINSKDEELSELYNQVIKSPYVSSTIKIADANFAISDFSLLEPVDQRRIIKDILDANMLYVNQTDIDDDEMNVSDVEKSFNRNFYG